MALRKDQMGVMHVLAKIRQQIFLTVVKDLGAKRLVSTASRKIHVDATFVLVIISWLQTSYHRSPLSFH
jgi:hypothetical protein